MMEPHGLHAGAMPRAGHRVWWNLLALLQFLGGRDDGPLTEAGRTRCGGGSRARAWRGCVRVWRPEVTRVHSPQGPRAGALPRAGPWSGECGRRCGNF